MTLRDSILADSEALARDTSDGAAEPVGWYHEGEAGVELAAVPEVLSDPYEPDDYGIDQQTITLWFGAADVAGRTHGDVIIWRDRAYRVRAIEPNDWGLVAVRVVAAADLLVEQYRFPEPE